MLADFAAVFHRIRRRLSRSEWAIRHFGFGAGGAHAEEPGLLLIQIDGLSRRQLETALTAGRMPFLQRLRQDGEYRLHTFYSGVPSTTPAVQAELYYGVRAGVPAFQFLDRSTNRIGFMFDPEWAKRFEKEFAAQAEGLLTGGSSWSNIFQGGAAPEESHFCAASLGLGDLWRTGKPWNFLVFCLFEIPALLRVVALMLAEIVLALSDAVLGIVRGRAVWVEAGAVLSRVLVSVGLREVVTIGAKVDLARGLPIVHVNYLGYDEQSHMRGPGSWYAHWSLRGIDSALRELYLAAHRSARRDYQVWIFSDHGQEHTQCFAADVPGGIHDVLADCLAVARVRDGAFRRRQSREQWLLTTGGEKRRRARLNRDGPEGEGESFRIAAMGPVGHVYFREAWGDDKKRALARRVVEAGRVPGVLWRDQAGEVFWCHRDGEVALPSGAADLLSGHPEALRGPIAEDLAGLVRNAHAGDLVLLAWGKREGSWTFAAERGAHAGPGPEETQGFLIVPPATQLPVETKDFVRPSALRAAARHLLGRERFPSFEGSGVSFEGRLRVMSYNVHNCAGMDGRVSPRRIARVVARQEADLVALQELDQGRARSRGEDQARQIADALGFHVAFCPTVLCGEERYGHAVLCRWPIEIVKVGPLPHLPGGVWPEARGALWTRISLGSQSVNILTTHLGLSARERALQMNALLGPEWLGPVLDFEPVIFCGDWNLTPGSAGHRLAAGKLRDSVEAGRRGIPTFSSIQPWLQLDHIFVSSHFAVQRCFASRNDLTRLASDHLPLVADVLLRKPDEETAVREPESAPRQAAC